MINCKSISQYRGELMGVAMLFVILFHIPLARQDAFFGLHRLGNIGVDMFLFLSGIGLWFAWMKPSTPIIPHLSPRILTFYRRRFIRIMPAWLIMASLFYVPDFLGPRQYSPTWFNLIGDITINIDFWLHDELTFWYIPALMALYLMAPFYMELIRRYPAYRWLPVLMITWCVAMQWVTPINQAVGHIEIFWSRMPIFFIGINIGEAVKQGTNLSRSTLSFLVLLFVSTFSLCLYLEQVRHGKFPLFVERMVYIPLTVSTIMLLIQLFNHTPSWLLRFFAFVGSISLETYLIHVHFVMKPIAQYHLGYWPTFLLTIVITLPLAWLLLKIVNLIASKL